MPVKIRLQRFGKKGKPFYHIVIADGRAPRDGKFIEKIGSYNPVTQPATIEIDIDKAVDWLDKGAQPTDTVRAMLSYKGILYKRHLMKGVAKEAFTEQEAEARFQAWVAEKEAKIQKAKSSLDEADRNAKKAIMDAEIKVNEERAAEIAKRKADAIEEKVAEAQAANAETEAAAEEAPATEENTETNE